MHRILALVLLASLRLAAGPAADLSASIARLSLDRGECYRISSLAIPEADIHIFLNRGHLIFSKPVEGRRIAAVFTAAGVEGGDGEVLLMPPDRAERASLASYTGSPALNEHFRSAVFLFTGEQYEQIHARLASQEVGRPAPEMAALLDEEWGGTVRSLAASFQTRLSLDLLGAADLHPRLFLALVQGQTLGSFGLVYDPNGTEQITAGRVAERNGQRYFDTWTNFPARAAEDRQPSPSSQIRVAGYRIEARINPDLSLDADTRLQYTPLAASLPAAAFDIASEMAVSAVTVDGAPTELLRWDASPASARADGSSLFLVVPSAPLQKGRTYEIAFHHAGKVIQNAGNGVLLVQAKATWYPTAGPQFATYDLLFRYPKNLDLVATGSVTEDRIEGDWHITRRSTPRPVRVVGFNLGNYDSALVKRDGYSVDLRSNRELETSLQPQAIDRAALAAMATPGTPRQIPTATLPEPRARLERNDPAALAEEIARTLEYMATAFGPPALPLVTVSPVPDNTGVGFPGLIYLPTRAYLTELPTAEAKSITRELFFKDVLQAHEIAHQWWGNRVASASYRDDWLLEALANYSALLYLEHNKGVRSIGIMLESYRTALLARSAAGKTVESTGPIVLGRRLENSIEPRGWNDIVYGKGSWILHMLRKRLGDKQFMAMLAALASRYDQKEVSTAEFRQLAASFLPPKADDPQLESFFDQWVYGTGIPELKLTSAVKGKAPNLRLTVTVRQSGVPEEFSVAVPVEIQLAPGQSVTRWVQTGGDTSTLTMAVKRPPVKVLLDPGGAVLKR